MFVSQQKGVSENKQTNKIKKCDTIYFLILFAADNIVRTVCFIL